MIMCQDEYLYLHMILTFSAFCTNPETRFYGIYQYMRGELHRRIPPVRWYPARIPRVQAAARQSCPAPNAGWPGIQAGSPPVSSHFPSRSQIIPMNIQPIQLRPLLPTSNLPNASLWAISLFFSPNAQNPV